jgi:serine phosphatase RsbU (regulator of sigma subunit)
VVAALRRRRGRPLGLALLAALIVLLVGPELRPVHLVRLAGFDSYQHRWPRARASAPVAIVEIDEASLARHGQWPWPRTLLARLIAQIGAGEPAAIGIDILMPEADRLSPGQIAPLVGVVDAELAARVARLPGNDVVLGDVFRVLPVVLGVAALDSREPTAASRGLRAPPLHAVGGDPLPYLRRYAAALASVEVLDAAAPGHGLLGVDLDAGVVRRIPLVAAVGNTVLPVLGLEMIRVASDAPAVTVRVGAAGIAAVGTGDLLLDTAPDGRVWLHYSPHDPARFVSALDVLSGTADPRQFAGKLVLVGVTAVGLSDYQATPVADRMAGVEIHAQLIEGIFDGSLLSRPGWVPWGEGLVLLLGGLLLIGAVPAVAARWSALLLVAEIAVVVGLGATLYGCFRVLFDYASPALALGAVFTAMLGTSLAAAQSQRRALRRKLERQREAAARMAGELEAARRIQMGILPSAATAFPGETRFDLYAHLEPAREVGGDLYDFFRLGGDRVFLLIGDVSGKGLPGSLFMALSKSLCKSIALRGPVDVGAVLRGADGEISRDNTEGLFVTVFAAVLDARTGELEYGNAGHEPPYLLGGGHPPERLDGDGGPPLCVLEGFPYDAGSRWLRPGEVVCLFTDGVTEATSPSGELYGRARLEALLARLPADAPAFDIGDAIRSAVTAFASGVEPADDIAILVLRWLGPAPGPTTDSGSTAVPPAP